MVCGITAIDRWELSRSFTASTLGSASASQFSEARPRLDAILFNTPIISSSVMFARLPPQIKLAFGIG